MNKLALTVASGIMIFSFSMAMAGWSTPEMVNDPKEDDQYVRAADSVWPICVDDSILVQVVWEDISGISEDIGEVYYRAKPLRNEWGDEKDVTSNDGSSTNPGHPSLTTYKTSEGDYKTIVAYASQVYNGNEYKSRMFNRDNQTWAGSFLFISEEGGLHLMAPGAGDGGQKTGNLIDNGDNKTFAAWPYRDPNGGTNCYRLWYRVRDNNGWSDEGRVFGDNDTYWSRDVCPCADPNHDVHLAYSYSTDNSTYNIYWMKYSFGAVLRPALGQGLPGDPEDGVIKVIEGRGAPC